MLACPFFRTLARVPDLVCVLRSLLKLHCLVELVLLLALSKKLALLAEARLDSRSPVPPNGYTRSAAPRYLQISPFLRTVTRLLEVLGIRGSPPQARPLAQVRAEVFLRGRAEAYIASRPPMFPDLRSPPAPLRRPELVWMFGQLFARLLARPRPARLLAGPLHPLRRIGQSL